MFKNVAFEGKNKPPEMGLRGNSRGNFFLFKKRREVARGEERGKRGKRKRKRKRKSECFGGDGRVLFGRN